MDILASAKLNLALHITGKRPDGYHLLDSLVAFTEFGDRLTLTPADTLSLEVRGEFASDLEASQNLVWRAAVLLQQHIGRALGAAILLQKNIPVGAGLGGGSSDAAAALRGLCALWEVDIERGTLTHIAQALGSDMPVCEADHPACMSGIGERIEPVALDTEVWLVLVNPRRVLATADVYREYSGQYRPASTHVCHIPGMDVLLDVIAPMHNDLQLPAIRRLPVISEIIAALSGTPGCLLARMSGSGATCFGIYLTRQEAAAAAHELRKRYPAWWCMATKLKSTI